MGPTDSGSYTCKGVNGFGYETFTFTVAVGQEVAKGRKRNDGERRKIPFYVWHCPMEVIHMISA